MLYWLESRPAEKGRTVVVARAPGSPSSPPAAAVDITPPLPGEDEGKGAPFFNVRTRVHEYGGGALCVIPGTDESSGGGGGGGGEDTVLFSNFADQRLYLQRVSIDRNGSGKIRASAPKALTPEGSSPSSSSALRFADAEPDPLAPHGRIFVVVEDHEGAPSPNEPENCLATVDLKTGEVTKIARGSDFYSSPRPSPDGKRIAWVEWVRGIGFFVSPFGVLSRRRDRERERRQGGRRNEGKKKT